MSSSEKRQRTAHISARVTPEEKELFRQLCHSSDMTEGEFIRAAIFKRRYAVRFKKSSANKETLLKILAQLGKIGSNVNQIARRINTGFGVQPGELEDMKKYLSQARDKIEDAL